MFRNRVLSIAALFTFAGLLVGQTPSLVSNEPIVVFVCEHGAAKSIIAAAEFNRLAQEKKLPYRAIARGTNPDAEYATGVVAGMKKDGLAIPTGRPTLLTSADVENASRVVTLGCKLPQPLDARAKPVNWADISSPSESYEAARQDIARHVRELIADLANRPSTK